MDNQALFVDFMYAVTVGAALPRIDKDALDPRLPLAWGLLFLLAVFLEDFYVYHVKVVPHLDPGFPSWRGFILTMVIIGSWYLSQTAFPFKPRVFLVSFALFFALKLLGGFLLRLTPYPANHDLVFLLPIAAALLLVFLSKCGFFESHPGRLLWVLAPAWLLMVVLWWSMDASAAHHATTTSIRTP